MFWSGTRSHLTSASAYRKVPMNTTANAITARVSRTWNSTRCSMTGIFLSSSGLNTES